MATYRDFDGVYFTLNALRLYHATVMHRCELVVVDNDPNGPQAERLRGFLAKVASGAAIDQPMGSRPRRDLPQPFHVNYVGAGEVQGTSAPRDLIFDVANGDAVLVLDSHVDVWPNGIARLLDYVDSHPDTGDLLQGPLVMDDLAGAATHFDDIWRGGMWGTWGCIWQRADGRMLCARQTLDKNVGLFAPPTNDLVETLPLAWSGHEHQMPNHGFQSASQGEVPFEIPAQGLGLFACRRKAWLKFNPKFREFGGEEWYIHTKFRQAGHKCLCLPWLKWMHRFADPAAGRHYARSNEAKIRNYISGLQELGIPLDRLRRHFVDGISEDPTEPRPGHGTIDSSTWHRLIAEANGQSIYEKRESQLAQPTMVPVKLPIQELFRLAVSVKSDINEHCPKLRELASDCDTVVEFGHRPTVSTVALLAGQPKKFITYSTNPPRNLADLKSAIGSTRFEFRQGDSLSVEIPKCDLLFIDTKHTSSQLWAEFQRHLAKVTRYIVLHDTQIFGIRGEDGQDGLISAIRRLVNEYPEWAIIYHTSANYGLTVLSCQVSDHPSNPILLWPVGFGPGTELKAILATLGIAHSPTCDCNARARQMDEWGVPGCKMRRDEIIEWLREGQARWGWKDKLAAAAKAVTSGLALKLNPLDVFSSLVDESIQRAESIELALIHRSGKETAAVEKERAAVNS